MEMLNDTDAVKLSEMFHLMGDANRLRIIYACLGHEVSAGSLAQQLSLSPSLVSHHLRLLKSARILSSERKGRQIFYCAIDDHIRHILIDMVGHISEEGVV